MCDEEAKITILVVLSFDGVLVNHSMTPHYPHSPSLLGVLVVLAIPVKQTI